MPELATNADIKHAIGGAVHSLTVRMWLGLVAFAALSIAGVELL